MHRSVTCSPLHLSAKRLTCTLRAQMVQKMEQKRIQPRQPRQQQLQPCRAQLRAGSTAARLHAHAGAGSRPQPAAIKLTCFPWLVCDACTSTAHEGSAAYEPSRAFGRLPCGPAPMLPAAGAALGMAGSTLPGGSGPARGVAPPGGGAGVDMAYSGSGHCGMADHSLITNALLPKKRPMEVGVLPKKQISVRKLDNPSLFNSALLIGGATAAGA